MNIHHLELFYFVARHGGISEAVRNIPYGIQQPAVSAQVLQLEADLGTSLFQRRPFQLTAAGAELYEFVQPFFANLDAVAENIRGGASQLIRIAATSVVVRHHLPELLKNVRGKFPRLRFTLREGIQPQITEWLARQEVDLGVTALEGKPPPGIKAQPLLEVPLVLVVGKEIKIKSAEELWKRDRISETLISLPANQTLSRLFQQELARRKVDWPVGIEVNSIDLVETYAANGFGIGLSVAVPKSELPRGLRALPLEGFPPVIFGVLWQGRPTPMGQMLLGELQRRAAVVAKQRFLL